MPSPTSLSVVAVAAVAKILQLQATLPLRHGLERVTTDRQMGINGDMPWVGTDNQ